jgi:predicted esterase
MAWITVYVLQSCTTAPDSGDVNQKMPDQIDPSARYMIYLHGRIIEDEGIRPTHPKYGTYEYEEILESLSAGGLQVISEVRSPDTDGWLYAQKVKRQIQTLIQAGVPPQHIYIIGFSKGGAITIVASSLLKNELVNFIIIAACGEWVFEQPDIVLHGRVLSIYEASDALGVSCQPLFNRSEPSLKSREVRTTTGDEHGAFYRPRSEWINPVLEWVEGVQ